MFAHAAAHLVLICCFFSFYYLFCVCVFGQIPSGVFVPSLCSGALLGRAMGWAMYLWHESVLVATRTRKKKETSTRVGPLAPCVCLGRQIAIAHLVVCCVLAGLFALFVFVCVCVCARSLVRHQGDIGIFSVCKGHSTCVTPALYAVIGASAVLGGITRMTRQQQKQQPHNRYHNHNHTRDECGHTVHGATGWMPARSFLFDFVDCSL